METKLTELVGRLKEAAGKNLESVILYGSAARGEFHPGASDLNVLCTLVQIDVNEMQRLAPTVGWWIREMKEPAPLFFLTEELQRSTDVFAIESLDLKRSHRVLFGRDVAADLQSPMNLHRIELEHELRLLLMRLRQHLLHAGQNEMDLLAMLKSSISSAATLLRHTLLAFDEEPPQGAPGIFARIEELTGAKAEAFARIYSYHAGAAMEGDSLAAYDAYMHALEKVILALDKRVPKAEWQRVAR